MLTVRAPATSANLGPGYDCLSLALDVANVVSVEPADRVEVAVVGEGAANLPTDATNEVYRSLALVFETTGHQPPTVRLRCDNRIPPSRGLGSSSAARASGLLLGNRLLGDPLTRDELLTLGARLEGHADNIAACLLGGVQVCVPTENGVVHCGVSMPAQAPRPRAVIYVPDFPMDTHEARGLLPTAVSIPTAVYNIGRASLFVAALAAGRYDLLRTATEDAIHQPARGRAFRSMPCFFDAALEAGAFGAFLSGAGSSILALVDEEHAHGTSEAFLRTAERAGVSGRLLYAGISDEGATILEED